MQKVIDDSRKQLLSNHLDIYSGELVTPNGEYLYFDSLLVKEMDKLPYIRICFQDESEWLKED